MITIFTICKPFEGRSRIIQYNAIKSWTLLNPQPQIILFGDEPGVAAAAKQLDVQHVRDLKCNQADTPLLDDAFSQAYQLSTHDILVYTNADIIFFNDFITAVEQIKLAALDRFLMIGRRTNLEIDHLIDFEEDGWEPKFRHLVARQGVLGAVVAKDYFVYPKPLYAEIPEFAVGRGHWDNWMVHQAHCLSIPVVDATEVVEAVHQNHDYAHINWGGLAIVNGWEAQQNARLGGGMNLIYGSASTWRLTSLGLKRRRVSALIIFLADLPRFFRLLIFYLINSK